MSARRGDQFVQIGMPTICWKTFSPQIMKMLSTRNSFMLIMSSSVYFLFESECSLTKLGFSSPEIKNLVSAISIFCNKRAPEDSYEPAFKFHELILNLVIFRSKNMYLKESLTRSSTVI